MSLVEPALAERVLARALSRGGDFAELYAEARHGFGVSIDDRRVERPQGGRERGACVRVVHGDSSYYGHVDGLAEEDLLRVAASVAEGLRGEASEPAALSAAERAGGHAIEIRPEEVAAARKADLLRACDERARDAGSEVSSGAHRLRRVAASGRGLQLARPRRLRRPHPRATERAGGGTPRRPRGDRHRHARRPRRMGADRGRPGGGGREGRPARSHPARSRRRPHRAPAGGGGQRLRGRVAPRSRGPRPGGRCGPKAGERLRRAPGR